MRITWIWLKAHRWPDLVAVCAVVAAVGVLLGRQVVPVPSLSNSQVAIPLMLLLPVVLGCAVGLHSRNPTTLFDVVPRSHVPARAALVLVLVATVALTSLALPDGVAALRNTLGLTGMALATAAVVGATRSWTLPLFFLMASLLFGARARLSQGVYGPAPWAYPLADAKNTHAMTLACGIFACGALLYVLRGPRAEVAN